MSVRGMVEADFPEIALDICAFPPSLLALRPPVEILQEIFLFLADLYHPPSLNSSGQPDWIAVTYVCRYWRSAALGIPKLWSSITPGLSVSWSWVMMERSAPLSMCIDMRIGACYEDGLEPFAASELLFAARIRTLRLSGYVDDILNVLHVLHRPSLLESLSLHAVPNEERSFYIKLPETLFGGKAPFCRRLTFETYVCIQAPRWLLTGITQLTISSNVTLLVLLGALQETLQLEMLCIATPLGWPPGSVPPPRVALPRLSLLSFYGTPRHLVTLSSYLDVPHTLRRRLFWSTSPILLLDSLAELFADTQAFIPHDSAPGVDDGGLRIARVTGGRKRGSFEVWSRAASGSASAAAREDALFLFNISWDLLGHASRIFNPPPPYPFFRLVSPYMRLGIERVEHLTVASETAIEDAGTAGECAANVLGTPDVAEQCQALLAMLPSVKTVRLHRSSPACLSVLRALSASENLLPHLERVLVVQSIVRYAAAHLDGTGVTGSGFSSAVVSREFVRVNLGAELVNRVKERSGLEVVLVRCDVDGDALDALRERARVTICDSDELER
ncbi:hypothetical protein EDB87DRAFT_1684929 [Lactarius vividus]|nr:hypothetical protein EDB87DRAFT_1684929 [Lactarius vividus]